MINTFWHAPDNYAPLINTANEADIVGHVNFLNSTNSQNSPMSYTKVPNKQIIDSDLQWSFRLIQINQSHVLKKGFQLLVFRIGFKQMKFCLAHFSLMLIIGKFSSHTLK